MSEWQPIETAPRDGLMAVWWFDFADDTEPFAFVGFWLIDGGHYEWIVGAGNESWVFRGAKAWMPLPAPPALTAPTPPPQP